MSSVDRESFAIFIWMRMDIAKSVEISWRKALSKDGEPISD